MNLASNSDHMKIYEIDNILIDLQLREIAYETSIHRPSPEAFSTLIYLIENRERVINIDEFRSSLWKDETISEFEILRNLMKARQAVLDSTAKKLIIYNAEEKGYQFIGDVLEIEFQ